MLAPWIIEHLPRHRIYVEPYGGAASVLLRKPRSYGEVYNDLDDEVVSLFRVLRGPERERLIAALALTPFARGEFYLAYEPTDCDVERARRLVVRSFMGFGSDGHNPANRTGFRGGGDSNRSGSTPAHDWVSVPGNLAMVADRLMGCVIENRPAIDVMRQHDGPDTLHYVDPPYLPETRSSKKRKGGGKLHAYRYEMSADDHVEMLQFLTGLSGAVVLSGYPSKIYDHALAGWQRIERPAFADGARKRREVIWMNPQATGACSSMLLDM